MTDKQKANLKRGKLVPQSHGGALMVDYHPGDVDRLRRGHERIANDKKKVIENPEAALELIHADLTSLTQKILRAAARDGKVPDRGTMDVVREFRQSQEAVNEARRARGAVAEAEDWLSTLDARVAEATARMEAGPQPPAAIPV